MNWLRIYFVVLFCVKIATASTASTADTFAAANEAYNKKDFGTAIASYESLVRRGEYRPEIFYNLGLAYEASVNPARAVLNYERALLIAPGYADAQQRCDALGDAPAHWWEQLPRIGSRMSVGVAVAAAWILLLAIVAYWRDLGNSRPLWSVSAVIGLFVLAIAAASFRLREYPLANSDRAIVLKSEKLRSNFTANSPSILSLKPGQSVQITSVNGPWTACRLPDYTRGWVATPSLERVVPQG